MKKLKRNKIYLIDGIEGQWNYKGTDEEKTDYYKFTNKEKETVLIRDDQDHQIQEV